MGKESTLRAPLPRPRIRTYFRKMYHLPIYRLLLVLLGLPTAIMVVVKHLFFSSSSAYQKLKRELAAQLEADGLLQKLTEQATISEQNKARFLNRELTQEQIAARAKKVAQKKFDQALDEELALRMRRDGVPAPDLMNTYLEWLDSDAFFWISVVTSLPMYLLIWIYSMPYAKYKMLELDDNDNIVTNRALAYNYSIGEGNSTFYFVLRDNVGFYTAINGELVDTGEKVGAEDVIFTYNRLRNPDAVPGHQVYDNYACISDVASVTDLSELENTVDAETGKTVKEILEAGLPAPISELVSSKNATNNAAGKYEVVKVTTSTPFPQILNFLCDHCSGIVSKKQVESINTPELLANYDPTKDTRYGDAQYLMEGSGKQNTLWCSGPYVIKSMNDYEAVCERNPAFMPGTEMAPVIKNITLKYIADKDASISALRSGEIDVTDNVPANQVQVVESDANLGLVSSLINGCIQMKFNLDEDHITNNEDIRKAILYSINQDEVVAVKNGLGGKCYTAMTMLKNDNDLIPDPNKVKEHLDNYFASLG